MKNNEKVIEYMIIRMRVHIVRSCRPLSRFMVSVALRCRYLETLLLTLASGVGLVGMNSDPLSGVSTLYCLLVFSKADL